MLHKFSDTLVHFFCLFVFLLAPQYVFLAEINTKIITIKNNFCFDICILWKKTKHAMVCVILFLVFLLLTSDKINRFIIIPVYFYLFVLSLPYVLDSFINLSWVSLCLCPMALSSGRSEY